MDVYEIFWTGGTTGNWNSTRDGERDLFLVRVEGGRYHVVRDWWRSIFRVTNPHSRLPLDESHPFWERIALMNYWIEASDSSGRLGRSQDNDPAGVLTSWRRAKILRGLLRHPNPNFRIPACRELLMMGWNQDECWEMLPDSEKAHLADGGYNCSAGEVADGRKRIAQQSASRLWNAYSADQDTRRLLTTINNREIRQDICLLYAREYPGDTDAGCPTDRTLPATIVTERGDLPLTGPMRVGESSPQPPF